MKKISIVHLENNSDNKKILTNLIIKDTQKKCFGVDDPDEPEKLYTPEEMTESFFEDDEFDIFGIKYDNKYIGMLSIHDGIVGIFIEPEYQRRGFAKKALLMFEKMALENYKCNELIAEIISDNQASINLFSNLGYEYNEQYNSPMNGVNATFLKYKKVLSNNQKNITQII